MTSPTPRAADQALLALVEAGEMLGPVDAVVEPVEDQQQHADRDHRDDRLELLAVPRERAEHRLRDHPGERRRDERDRRRRRAAAAGTCGWRRPCWPSAPRGSAPPRALRGRRRSRCSRRPPWSSPLRCRRAETRRRARRRALRARPRAAAPASFRFTSWTSPAWSPSPYQNSPSMRWNSDGAMPRSRCSGPSSKIPYASSRACSARLQLPASAALASRSSDAAITSKSAPGGCLLPRLGIEPVDQLERALRLRRDALGRGDGAAADGARVEIAAERLEDRGQLARRRGVALRAAWGRCRRARPRRRRGTLIASWISNGTVTRLPSTPRSYSIGTSRRKRSSWPARRACSAGGERRGPEALELRLLGCADRARPSTRLPSAAACSSSASAASRRSSAAAPRCER